MKHTEIALRRPVTTIVVFAALALVGLIASRLLPLEKFPDIEFPGIFIQIPYAGSTPEEIERLITRPVEEALATLSGVETMFSRSSSDQAEIFLQFDWDQSMGAKGIEARAKVDGIREQLPADIRRILDSQVRLVTNLYCKYESPVTATCRTATICSTACSSAGLSASRACHKCNYTVSTREKSEYYFAQTAWPPIT